jgi:hypothetical protein
VNPSTTGASEIKFSGVAGANFGDQLFFLSSQPHNAQDPAAKSDVCFTGYYLDYKAPPTGAMPGSPSTFKLFRYFKDSNTSFTKIKDYTTSGGVLMDANSTNDEVLARNVVDVRFKALDENLNQITNWDPKKTPHAIDISLTAYNYSAANRFTSREDWLDFTSSKNAPSRQTFSTRVYLNH